MKKILISLIAILLLAGCSNEAVTKISEPDTVIWQSEKDKFTSEDLYELMKTQDYTSVIMDGIIKNIADKEGINYEDTLKEIEDTYDSFIAMGYESYLNYYYGDKQSYVSQMLTEGVTLKILEKKASDNYSDYVNEYDPYKAEIAYFDSEETAKAVIEAVNANENTFAFSASENGYTGTIEETIYHDNSDLPVEVKEVAQSMSTSGLSKIITTSVTSTDANGNSTVTPRYYVINMIEPNVDNFKDEFVSFIAENYLDRTEVLNELIKKYEVKVYDQNVYETLVQTYDGIGY